MAGASDGRVAVGGPHLTLIVSVVVERSVVDPKVVLPVDAVSDHLIAGIARDASVET